jgi:hypothetical protein
LAAEHRTIVSLVYVADRLAADAGQGFRQDLLQTTIDPEVRDSLKLTNEKLDEIRAQLQAQMQDINSILG